MKKVDIRFNTNFPSRSQYEWRVLINGEETLVNNVRIETPSYTTATFIEGHGMKWHLSTEANEIEIDNSLITNKLAIIK
jgi:hypothetical protein